jgi:tRNA(fMet)-specific endonuclease VapC
MQETTTQAAELRVGATQGQAVGLVIDSNVLILAEKAQSMDFSRWSDFGKAYISAVTVSELLVGVEKANTPQRKLRRAAFVEQVLASLPVLDFNASVARTHARMIATLPVGITAGTTAGTQDSLIAATALYAGHAILTHNVKHFEVFAGLQVVAWAAPA